MTALEIFFACVTAFAALAAVIIAMVALNKRSAVDVSFSGVPVDKKDFEKHVEENGRDFDNLHYKIGGAERGVEKRLAERIEHVQREGNESRRALHTEVGAVARQVSRLEANDETNTARLVQMDGKIDRLIERMHE